MADFIECGCCSCYHRVEFEGDCRDDDERFTLDEIPDDAIIEMLYDEDSLI